MRWLIGSAPDFRGRDPRFESSISHNDRDELQDNCVIKVEKNLRVEKETYPCGKKRSKNIYIYNLTNKGRSPFPARDIFLSFFFVFFLLYFYWVEVLFLAWDFTENSLHIDTASPQSFFLCEPGTTASAVWRTTNEPQHHQMRFLTSFT